ncbi:crotonase/enoyl-CoA hydratase family protein [Nocardioides sp. GY 10113]|uniref:crotonase/enoyl-CoA hydratase family protein n=1 Tax=Nocardioides sp. GY 10113 TaxID=2569761 RepID=UPI0010A83BD6|nr:crotonase/enoyl-CoA hydratase family protein [Nocardioides sp. GY 10113]TIC89157.1 crotonase/enoyl-CoA hydratase family protein [Nocardioides sp. GY 10113]
MNQTESRVRVSVTEGVADVVLNRADKRNALDGAMFEAILATIDELGARDDVRAVVLSGAGGAFSAGIDLSLLAGGPAGDGLQERTHGLANAFQQVAWGWRTLPVPVIAAIEGVCFGGGLQIALGADLRLTRPDARLAVMEARWALVPDMAGFPLLRGLVRADRFRELVYTAREVSGTEAAEIGLATRVSEDPHADALELAGSLAAQNPGTTRAAKRLLDLTLDEYADPAALLLAESVEQEALLGSEAMAQLLNRFLGR